MEGTGNILNFFDPLLLFLLGLNDGKQNGTENRNLLLPVKVLFHHLEILLLWGSIVFHIWNYRLFEKLRSLDIQKDSQNVATE